MNASTNESGGVWNVGGRPSTGLSRPMLGMLGGLLLSAAPAWAAPQIEVRVNNQVIGNNQEVSFDDTALGDSSALIVVVRNVGNEDLLFTGDPIVSIFGGFAEYFSVIQPPLEAGNKLSPNGSTAFRVDFAPGHVAERLDSKAFLFTNSTSAAFGISLRGRSVGPRMIVKQDGVAIADGSVVIFPDTPIGETSTVELVIENAGNAALSLTGTPPASLGGGQGAQFAITQQPGAAVGPAGSVTLAIAFTPTTATAVSIGLFMAHNEQSLFQDGLFGAAVQGRGLPAAEIIEENAVLEDELGNQNENDNGNEVAEENGHEINDNGEYEDDKDGQGDQHQNAGDELDEEAGLSPLGNTCGFGIGFAVPACMFGLCGVRAVGRGGRPGR